LGEEGMAGRYGRVRSTASWLLLPIRSKLLGSHGEQALANTSNQKSLTLPQSHF